MESPCPDTKQELVMNSYPIFIMSSERSGSNLLRVLLSNHSKLAAPTAPQILATFSELVPYYGPLSNKENARRLFEDILMVVNHPYHSWQLLTNFDYVYEKYKPSRFLDFFHSIYSEDTQRNNKIRYVCKENNIFNFAFHLIEYYKKPKFIYLYRDPRDYAASWLKLPAGPKTLYSAAISWLGEQKICDILLNSFNLEACKIKYEDLITKCEQVMSDLLTFLGEDIEEACFEVNEGSNLDLTWNSFWKNLNKPIISENCRKYVNVFDVGDINLIETVTKEYMIRLGYELDTRANWKESKLFGYKEAFSAKARYFKARRLHSETYELLSDRMGLAKRIAQKRKKEWFRAGPRYIRLQEIDSNS